MQTITRYAKQFVQYVRKNSAVSALEYAILVGAIAIAIAVALNQFGGDLRTSITNIGDQVGKKIGTTQLKKINP